MTDDGRGCDDQFKCSTCREWFHTVCIQLWCGGTSITVATNSAPFTFCLRQTAFDRDFWSGGTIFACIFGPGGPIFGLNLS